MSVIFVIFVKAQNTEKPSFNHLNTQTNKRRRRSFILDSISYLKEGVDMTRATWERAKDK